MSDLKSIASKLDLDEYINSFKSFFVRPKSIAIEGDINQHFGYIKALSSIEFPQPKSVMPLDNALARVRKQAVLSIDEIYAFVVIVEYFNRLRATTMPEPLSSWVYSIEIPDDIKELTGYFTDEGDLNPIKVPELGDIQRALQANRQSVKETLYKLTHSSKLEPFLIDTQVHLQNGEDTLLVRGGFSQAIKASVVGRSSGGYFYILPQQVAGLKERADRLKERKEEIIYQYSKEFSKILYKWERFLSFVNREYDRFDHYQARVNFAKAYDYEFVLPNKDKKVILSDFAHPAIEKPTPVNISLDRSIMLITGVNAGGKTMLLKSILSAVFMSKYMLPFRCNASQTHIGKYKNIEAIIDDPQSVKNDISTFAGRMQEFAALFRQKDSIVGVDEIELGTDADEAAALFKVLLDELKIRGNTFVVTTHHKRLASLMAADEDVELVAALYDEHRRVPTYTFLQGSIGKSYAFETAQRYGISEVIVERAKKFYGEDKERLGELIERSTMLERQMRQKISELEDQKRELQRKENYIEQLKEQMQEEQRKALATLENRYNAATKRALKALKSKESADGRRLLNEAHKHKQKAKQEPKIEKIELKVGDRIKYRSHFGELLSLKSKEATIIVDGLKMRVPLSDLKPAPAQIKKQKPKEPKATSSVQKSGASVSIKLLGMFGDEAIEAVDKFLSDALVNGLEEVEIIHGTGSGILAKLVTEYLQNHPKIQRFYRVPGNLGATIVEL